MSGGDHLFSICGRFVSLKAHSEIQIRRQKFLGEHTGDEHLWKTEEGGKQGRKGKGKEAGLGKGERWTLMWSQQGLPHSRIWSQDHSPYLFEVGLRDWPLYTHVDQRLDCWLLQERVMSLDLLSKGNSRRREVCFRNIPIQSESGHLTVPPPLQPQQMG